MLLAGFALFRLPYWFPPQQIVISTATNMGFNNRVVVMSVIGLIALLVFVRGRTVSASGELLSALPLATDPSGISLHIPMHKNLLVIVLAAYLGSAMMLFWTLPVLDGYGEAGYFLHRISLILQYGLTPYRDIEFGYGPALIYLPVWFAKLGQPLGLSLSACYLGCYALLCCVGVWLLFFVVDSVEIPVRRRVQLFCLMALAFFNISLGMQYLLIRFILPFALFIALHRQLPRLLGSESWIRRISPWGLCTLAGLAAFSVSPEVGLVYVFCQSAGFVFRMVRGDSAYFPCLLATLVTFPICLAVFTPGYLATVFMFAKGGANFPLVPSLFALFFLGTLFFIIPIAFSELRSHPEDPRSPLLLLLTLHPLLALPAALGRSDPGHLMVNGVGAFILTFALLAQRSPRHLRTFMVAMLVIFGGAAQMSSFWLYADYLKPVLATLRGRSRPAEIPSPVVSILGLERFSRIATPLGVDRATEVLLRTKGLYLPQYYPDPFNIGAPVHVARQILDLEKADSLLIPVEFLQFRSPQEIDDLWLNPGFRRQVEGQEEDLMRRVLLYPVVYRITRKPYLADLELAKHILAHYRPIGVGAGYAVMVPKRGA